MFVRKSTFVKAMKRAEKTERELSDAFDRYHRGLDDMYNAYSKQLNILKQENAQLLLDNDGLLEDIALLLDGLKAKEGKRRVAKNFKPTLTRPILKKDESV